MFCVLKHEFKLFFVTAFLLLSGSSSFGQLQRSLNLVVKFKIEDGDLKDSYLVISKQGGSSQTLPGTSSFKVDLDFNSTYILSFNKPGYITKKIELNTTMDDERRSQGVHFYDFVVVLFKQYDGVNIVVFNQPVAKIQYSKKIDDFDHDTDYTKSIQSALTDAENELKKKQAEEKRNPKPATKDSTITRIEKPKVEEPPKEVATVKKEEKKEEARVMESQKTDTTPAVSKNEVTSTVASGSDTKKEASGEGGKDEKTALKTNVGADNETVAELTNTQSKQQNLQGEGGSDEKNPLKPNEGKDNVIESGNKSGADVAVKPIEAEGNDKEQAQNSVVSESNKPIAPDAGSGSDNNIIVASNKSGNDNLAISNNPKEGQDKYVEPKTIIIKAKDEPAMNIAPTVETKIDREEINEDKRTILNVWVTKGNRTVMYSRIRYSWGGVFYFKDMKTSISEHFFNQAIAGK